MRPTLDLYSQTLAGIFSANWGKLHTFACRCSTSKTTTTGQNQRSHQRRLDGIQELVRGRLTSISLLQFEQLRDSGARAGASSRGHRDDFCALVHRDGSTQAADHPLAAPAIAAVRIDNAPLARRQLVIDVAGQPIE